MKLTLSPQAGLPGQPETELSVAGDVLTVDGVAFDLSTVPEGGEAMPDGDHPFIGPITRQGGVIHATVRVVLGDTAADHQPVDPAHWVVEVADGPVAIPAVRKPVTELEPEPEQPIDPQPEWQKTQIMGSSDGETWHEMPTTGEDK